MPLNIVRNDITSMYVDAIVNAANTKLQAGGGVCGAIFSAAGVEELETACKKLAPINTGKAVITPGFKLPAKYIIHTAGPVYRDGRHGEKALLRSCYINSLNLAVKRGCESIAFPLISSGIYGYPKKEALRVATAAIRDFLKKHDIDVSLVVFDKEALSVSESLFGAVDSYIDVHYTEEHAAPVRKPPVSENCLFPRESVAEHTIAFEATMSAPCAAASYASGTEASLDELAGSLDESFSITLLRLIDRTGKKDAEIYRRANIDRRLFSKIRSNENYTPSKPTVLAFAIALELTLDQTNELLKRAGFALSHSRKFDVIVEYFIKNRSYDVFEINEVLFSYDQPLLGG